MTESNQGPAAPGTAARCVMCDRLLEIGGCPQIGDGTDESVIACWQIAISRLKAENASLQNRCVELIAEAEQERKWHYEQSDKAHAAEKELEVWRNEDAREAKYEAVSKRCTAAEQRAEAAEKEGDEQRKRADMNGDLSSQWHDKWAAAEKRSTDLMEALRAAVVLCYSYGEDKPGLDDRKRPALCNGCEAEAWWRPGDGWVLWDGQSHAKNCPVGRAALHDEEQPCLCHQGISPDTCPHHGPLLRAGVLLPSKRHKCMRCGGEFACRTAGCTAGYDVLPRIVQRAPDGSLEVVEHECHKADEERSAPSQEEK